MAGQLWSVNALGGFMFSAELSNVLRMAVLPVVKFRQFCDAKDATDKGLQRGDKYSFNVYSKAATKGSGSGLDETTAMPETNFTITQKTVTITEFGNSVPYTGKLDNLSQHPVQEIIHRVLKTDCKQALDIAAWTQFNTTGLKVQAASGTSTTAVTFSTSPGTGSIGITNNVAFGKGHVRAIVDQMKEFNIPAFVGDDYYCIARPTTFSQVKLDLEGVYQYTETGFAMIMNGEIGRYYNLRFVEQTHIPKGGPDNTVTAFNPQTDTSGAWTNGKSDWIFFFGEDTVAEAIAIPEEIRGKIPTDFGRSKGVAWYALLGYGRTQGDQTAADFPNSRIVKWESQA